MGFETVFQILGWVSYVFGISIIFSNLLPGGWWKYYNATWRNRGLALPGFAVVLFWVLINAALSLGAYFVYENGGLHNGWDVYPFALMLFCITIIIANLWIAIYYNPCPDLCTNLTTYLFVATLFGIATFLFFLFIDILSGFLVLPLPIWLTYHCIEVIIHEINVCGVPLPKKVCEWKNIESQYQIGNSNNAKIL